MLGKNSTDLPPGFRFHPTDEELIVYYLRNQATSKPCPVSIIPEVDIYKFDPWQLPEKAEFGEKEWYFFTPRDRKYPNGVRPNRATVSGYWKATGTDKAIYSGSKYVGVKKALVFYKGRPPKGIKTDWIMHEYRLNDQTRKLTNYKPKSGSMRLDDWVLCRIYKKRQVGRSYVEEEEMIKMENSTCTQMDMSSSVAAGANEQHKLKFPRPCSFSNLIEFEYMGPVSQILADNNNTYNSNFDFFTTSNIGTHETLSDQNVVGEQVSISNYQYYNTDDDHQYHHSGKFQVNNNNNNNQSSIFYQPQFVNPLAYEFE